MNSVCTIDIGSNSVRYLVAEKKIDGIEVVRFNRHTTRLLARVEKDGMRFCPQSVEWIVGILEDVAADAASLGAKVVAVSGAHVLRSVENPGLLARAVKQRLGFEVETLSGLREGQLASSGAVQSLGLDPCGCTVIDVGGGSSEIIGIDRACCCSVVSVPVGAVNCCALFGDLRQAVLPAEVLRVLDAIKAKTADSLDGVGIEDKNRVVAVGGSASTLERILDSIGVVRTGTDAGTVLSGWIDLAIEKLCAVGLEKRCELFGLEEQRADIIIAGLCVWKSLLGRFDIKHLKVSFHGVCMGLACEYFEGNG